ncbi:hypothetical protein E2562_003372 [Oryza meyeriana var. granulata]|uniref:Uncharacterized protein n=1 Tax=Oryza meyeriana var. granulata TaxID=110450 RepID=A0A6G1EEE6_9ORYZ|nr:hypothetical protein E2562_003372 [Oryza meyeriana var. granulata]
MPTRCLALPSVHSGHYPTDSDVWAYSPWRAADRSCTRPTFSHSPHLVHAPPATAVWGSPLPIHREPVPGGDALCRPSLVASEPFLLP